MIMVFELPRCFHCPTSIFIATSPSLWLVARVRRPFLAMFLFALWLLRAEILWLLPEMIIAAAHPAEFLWNTWCPLLGKDVNTFDGCHSIISSQSQKICQHSIVGTSFLHSSNNQRTHLTSVTCILKYFFNPLSALNRFGWCIFRYYGQHFRKREMVGTHTQIVSIIAELWIRLQCNCVGVLYLDTFFFRIKWSKSVFVVVTRAGIIFLKMTEKSILLLQY